MKRRFANSFDFDPAKPLTVPYGTYPHKKTGVNQVVDRASADGFCSRLRQAQSSGAPGIPVYAGHPDVPELAHKYPDKSALGWVTAVGVGADACELAVEWVGEPPAPGAFIYFSPYFFGEDLSPTESHIDDMQSVGLTNRPNSTRFRLPNEAADEDPTKPERNTMKKVLALLGLAETATEDEAAAALQTLIDAKIALARKVEELTAELGTANSACETAKKGLANERDARIGLLLDCAIAEGRATPATRPVWEGRLRRDFANEAEALGKEPSALKTRSALPNEGPDAAPGILAKYEAMADGPEKDSFLRAHAVQINDARVALKR